MPSSSLRTSKCFTTKVLARRIGAPKWEKFFTTKDTKSTKFGVWIIRTLRVLRELRGELNFLIFCQLGFAWFFAGSKNKIPNAQIPPIAPAIVQTVLLRPL